MSKIDFKLVLLGNLDTGKTSLVKRYIDERFECRPHRATVGAAFNSKTITRNGRQFKIGIWDTAGSERYYAMSQLYYRDAKAAVVCFDITVKESYDRAKQWITELRNHEENCKIYLCGTKKDLVEDKIKTQAISSEKAMQYAKGIGATYIETSSKTGMNVAELFQLIADNFDLPSKSDSYESVQIMHKSKGKKCCA